MRQVGTAEVIRLLEIVRGAKTADDVLATALNLAKTIGKVPVVSGVCHGFIAKPGDEQSRPDGGPARRNSAFIVLKTVRSERQLPCSLPQPAPARAQIWVFQRQQGRCSFALAF